MKPEVNYSLAKTEQNWNFLHLFHLVSAIAVVNSSQWIASSPASRRECSPPPNFVNGHMLTIWFMVCCWPHTQRSDEARPHLCRLERQRPWPVRKWFSRDRDWRGRLNPGGRIVWKIMYRYSNYINLSFNGCYAEQLTRRCFYFQPLREITVKHEAFI